MILNNYYWLFEKIIPEHICDDIIKFAKSCDKKRGVTGGYENQLITGDVLKKLKKTRDSHIVWLNENWINNLIIPLVNQANKAANWILNLLFIIKTNITIGILIHGLNPTTYQDNEDTIKLEK